MCVDGCKRWVEFPATSEMMAGVGMWDRRRLPRSFLVGPPSVLPCCSPKLSCKGRSGRHVQPGALLSHDLVPCWRQLARRPDSWGNGLRHTRYKPQRSFMRACGISSFELAARVRCVWLLSSPLGEESRTPASEGRLLGRLKNERLGSCCLQLRSSTRDPRRLTGSQETGIELATTCRARLITAQI